MKKSWFISLLAVGGFPALLAGCQGTVSEDPPIHINPNMDFQEKYRPQKANAFFADGRAMRPQVPGTVARGSFYENDAYATGMENGAYVAELPVTLDGKLLARGRERYNIYCAPCHDAAGYGQGTVSQRGMLPPPSLHDDRLRNERIGYFYHVIANGVRNMPAYGAQVPLADRWAIAAYVRALQVSNMAGLKDVPADIAAQKGWK